MRYPMALESQVASWLIFGDKVRVPRYVKLIAEKLYPEELAALRSKVCPWCGRRFNSRRTLKLHLKSFRNHAACGFAFNSMVSDIANTYLRVRDLSAKQVMEAIATA